MLIVVALGGNALLQRGQSQEASHLKQNVEVACLGIAQIAKDHQVLICHGNGPQVGLLALQAEAYQEVLPYPLDILGAESQGMIGYLLQQSLGQMLANRSVVSLVTQVEVDPNDEAFKVPTKPIGPLYSQSQAMALVESKGWSMEIDGDDYRRVVASPKPQRIVEFDTIELLLKNNQVVIAAGGGGVPCINNDQGRLVGVEAVIDKDLTSSLLAEKIGADFLVILTDVDAIYLDWNTPKQQQLDQVSVQELMAHSFAPGSMAPKVAALCQFKSRSMGQAAIGRLDQLSEIVSGVAGTHVLAHVN